MYIERLFEIIYILMKKGTVSAAMLSQELEVSTKTIYRDIERLSMAGVPVYTVKGKNGGISLIDSFVMEKALFNEEEKLNILSALKAFEEISPAQDKRISRLYSFFGNPDSDWIEVDFASWSNPQEERLTFGILKEAILVKQVVSFMYHNGQGKSEVRFVEPLKLGFKNQAWYLYGFCRSRNAPRFFKLVRIQSLEKTNQTFDKTAPNVIFPKEDIFSQELISIKLRLSPQISYRVHEELPHATKDESGNYIAEITVPKGPWLYGYISSLGEFCEILEPDEIREGYIAQLKNILKNYL